MARFQQKILYIFFILSFELSVLLRRPIAYIDLVVIRNKLNISIVFCSLLKNVSYVRAGNVFFLYMLARKGRRGCLSLDFEL